jgi:hypothetical protein
LRRSQQQQAPQAPRQDFSRAPPPAKREAAAERNVLVLGDSMADWLAYGLEDAYSEQPDIGVIRKHKTASGLIKYQPKGEPADWAAAAKGILATEKPDAIVVMLGLNDRVSIREPVVEKKDEKKEPTGKTTRTPAPSGREARQRRRHRGQADDKPVDSELSPDDAADAPQSAAPERTAPFAERRL